MSQLIDHYGTEIELVISNNDEMALGAVEAYKKCRIQSGTKTGYFRNRRTGGCTGGSKKEGTMQGTVYNDNVDQAGEIARLAVDLLKEMISVSIN